jgi:hypothetical protein
MGAAVSLERALAELAPGLRAVYRYRVAEAAYLASQDPPERSILEALGGPPPATFREWLREEAKARRESAHPADAVAAAAIQALIAGGLDADS